MRHARFLIPPLAIALAAGGTVASHAGDATSLEGYNIVRVAPGLATADRLMDLMAPFYAGHPESIEGGPSMDLAMRTHGETVVVDLALGGYLDDAVSGEEYRALIIRNDDGQWEMLDLGQRNICRRGPNPGQPQTDPCP